MREIENPITAPKRIPWNKGKLIGPRPPLKHVWAIRTTLQIEQQVRDLALFNLAIDIELRGCNVVAIRVNDVAPNGHSRSRAHVAGFGSSCLAVRIDSISRRNRFARPRNDCLRNNIRRELVFDELDAVAQHELALFQALHLNEVGARRFLQGSNRGIEIAMLLLQARQLRPKLAFFLVCHRRLGRALVGPQLVLGHGLGR